MKVERGRVVVEYFSKVGGGLITESSVIEEEDFELDC